MKQQKDSWDMDIIWYEMFGPMLICI